MKLLGWMHRKLRQNSGNDPFKDFGIGGQSSADDQEYNQRPSYSSSNKPFRQSRDDFRKSFASLESAAARIDEDYYYEEDSSAISDLFHGFLAIGTLGSEAGNNYPGTPTFPFSVENITEKETEVTENELKLINDELEKVLIAEANKEDSCNLSSGRNSHVSNGRSSYGSSITLSGKTLEGQESNRNSSSVCPLQGYLLGSAIELPAESNKMAGPTKKENRTSLGELFQRTKMGEEFGTHGGKGENKEAEKSAVNLLKKMIKKKLMLHLNASKALPTDSASPENKLHKVLHMFHKKVHPENSGADSQKQNKNSKGETKRGSFCDFNGGFNSGQVMEDMDDIVIIPPTRSYKSQPCSLQYTLGGSESNGNREQWIKTDSDYLVLEL